DLFAGWAALTRLDNLKGVLNRQSLMNDVFVGPPEQFDLFHTHLVKKIQHRTIQAVQSLLLHGWRFGCALGALLRGLSITAGGGGTFPPKLDRVIIVVNDVDQVANDE